MTGHDRSWSVTATLPLLLGLAVAACDQGLPTAAPADAEAAFSKAGWHELAQQIRALAAERSITPMPPRPEVRDGLARLGQMLAFDPVLSGNHDISCMTCHHPTLATGDARSLAIGQGGDGLGLARIHPGREFISRNAPPLFNLHLLDHLFWDGRVFVDEAGELHTPVGAALSLDMTAAFEFGALSALGLLPVLSREEMRGTVGENDLADLPDEEVGEIWAAIMDRLGTIDEYRELFEEAYPGTAFEAMTFAHASNAIAGFFIQAFTFDNSPWDRFLSGNSAALSAEQLEGAFKFMNAPCSECHNGPGFSDDDFHNVALAQFGPGHGNGPSGLDDFGRMNVTGDPDDLYRFRTTMLRNVELTAPYGHAGEFQDLALFIDHYSQSADKLRAYSPADVPDPLLQTTLLTENVEDIIAARDPLILPVAFDEEFTRQVTAFMLALTDRRALNLDRFVPKKVPSGLPVAH
ncbi:MAG TPA: cytochrome c peroxidase [Longimicrobiales bacterium]|nr:cytochrome c peroxidase [Longimicrobiales bacterium]